MTDISIKYATAGDAKIFYREAGPANAPVVLLLHGFPASSFQYRNLIPILAPKYRVIAPDLPGFGFTEVSTGFKYSFDTLTDSIEIFLDTLGIKTFATYVFDYGAPVGFRLALRRPRAVTAIISQNGNAYVEGLGTFWAPIKKYWKSGSEEDRKALTPSFQFVKSKYISDAPDAAAVAPEAYWLDWALMSRPGNIEVQLDLFYDYRLNVELYPKFHEYFKESQVPLLAVWGKRDPSFIPAGAEAFKQDLPNATVKLIDAGHFTLDHKLEEVAAHVQDFLQSVI